MSKVHFPRSGGNAWVQTFYDAPKHVLSGVTGNVYYVDSSVSGSSTGTSYGRSPEAPWSSIAAAFDSGSLTANNNDLVLVGPGHTETISSAALLDCDTAGVYVLGLSSRNGVGTTGKPKINFTTGATADMDIDAANITFDGFYFDLTSVDSLDGPIDVNAAGFCLRNSVIELADSAGQADLAIIGDANADYMLVENNYFFGSTDAGTASCISLVGGDNITIRDNVIIGSFHADNGVILNATTDVVNILIAGNVIINRTASSTKVVVLTASSTGAIVNNRFGILMGTAPVTASGLDLMGGNYYKAAAGVAAGTLL